MSPAITSLLSRIRSRPAVVPPEWDARDQAIIERALPHTLTGERRLSALIDAVRYSVRRSLPGAFVECGVWRGGSALAMILTLQELGVGDRDIHLYDTFGGMTAPTEHDRSRFEPHALETWADAGRRQIRPWSFDGDRDAITREGVHELLLASGYPQERLHLIQGAVEDTLPDAAPESIALLRLDTDWYESTRHELAVLYPRLTQAGVLIVDDYGHWEGARRAVDEYFEMHPPLPLLNRIDYTGRVAVKP